MFCRGGLAELWECRDELYALMVVKHCHEPEETPQISWGSEDAIILQELAFSDALQLFPLQSADPRVREHGHGPRAASC